MIKSSERSRKDEVINVLDTGDSNRGNNSQEFTISKFNSATQVHIKPLYEIFHLGKSFLGWVGHLRSTLSLGATLPRAESTLDSSPTSIVPSLRTFNANACPLLCNKHVVWAHLFESYVENTVLKKSRILSSESSCAIICLSCSFYNGAKLSSDIKLAPVDQDFTSSEAAVNCAGAAAGWWCHLQKTCQHTCTNNRSKAFQGGRPGDRQPDTAGSFFWPLPPCAQVAPELSALIGQGSRQESVMRELLCSAPSCLGY